MYGSFQLNLQRVVHDFEETEYYSTEPASIAMSTFLPKTAYSNYTSNFTEE